ncbi:MAG: TolC family protein [Acidobacteria bacterium]|nr:TolC family protein [Acidobacteriota bacterium]
MRRATHFFFRLTTIMLAVSVTLAQPLAALAQSPDAPEAQSDQPPEPTQKKEGFSLGRVKPLAVKRVGVNVDALWYLSLREAILKALENNNDIQLQRNNVTISELSLKAYQGYYDPVFALGNPTPQGAGGSVPSTTGGLGTPGLGFETRSVPAASRLQAGRDSNAQTQKFFTYNFGVSQALPTGANWQLTFSNQRSTTNSIFATLNPQYFSTFQIEFTQPLLRNFRMHQPEQQIRIAKKALDLSDSQFRQRVIEIITQVQKAYYDLIFAIRDVEIKQESVELARLQHENNKKRVEAGTLARLELHQSTAEIERRNQDLITAVANVTAAENTLKGLILPHLNDPQWRANIVPTENIEYLPPSIDEESALRLALQNRPERRQLQLQKEQNEINIKYYANQARPQLNLFSRYASFGLAGTEAPPTPGSPFNTGVAPAQFIGGAGQAIENVFRSRFRDVAIGVTISFPFRNQTARANLGQAKAKARSLDLQEQQLAQNIAIEVRNAVQNLEAARQRIEAARAARLAREKQLEGEQERFQVGISTNFLVLQYQNELSTARGAELQALISYNKAIAELQRVMSTALDTYHLQIQSP